MRRNSRIAFLAGAALILAVSGTVLATRQPPGANEPAGLTQDDESPPTAEDLAHAADRLEDKGLDTSRLNELAAAYGIGGAVRLIAWSSDPEGGMSIDDLILMRDTGGAAG